MEQLQALVTGVVAGALGKAAADFLSCDVELRTDEQGNYKPEVYVTGRRSGDRLRISIEVLDPEP